MVQSFGLAALASELLMCPSAHGCLCYAVGQPAMMIYTAELLPTFCRSSVMGMCGQASRLGSLVAPFLLMLGTQLGSVGGFTQASANS